MGDIVVPEWKLFDGDKVRVVTEAMYNEIQETAPTVGCIVAVVRKDAASIIGIPCDHHSSAASVMPIGEDRILTIGHDRYVIHHLTLPPDEKEAAWEAYTQAGVHIGCKDVFMAGYDAAKEKRA